MLAFPGRAERAVLQARSLLDGAVIAASLLYSSWALVLGPVFRASHTGVLEQAIALAYPLGDVVLVTVVFTSLAGVALCWLRLRSGSLIAPALAHWTVNALGVIVIALA